MKFDGIGDCLFYTKSLIERIVKFKVETHYDVQSSIGIEKPHIFHVFNYDFYF